jgi:hypothetical protein
MGQIRGVVLVLDRLHPRERLLGREGPLGSHRGHKPQRLLEGQRWCPRFTRWRARTKN